jgi:hypothetical protein
LLAALQAVKLVCTLEPKMTLTVQSFGVVLLVPVWVLVIDVIPLMEPFPLILFWMSLN